MQHFHNSPVIRQQHPFASRLLTLLLVLGLIAPQLAAPTALAAPAPQETPPNLPSLTVRATQPSNGAVDVQPTGQVVVIFDGPAVPLVGIDAAASLPDPLAFEPAVEGAGEWIGTSAYAFQPTEGLAGGVEYTVQIDLTTEDGRRISDAFRFTTAAPIVESVMPVGNGAPPDGAVRVTFSQPMDRAATVNAVSLRPIDGGSAIDVNAAWTDDSRTLVLTPTQMLDFGASYAIEVTTEAMGAAGGRLRDAFSGSFGVVTLPAVVATSPENGDTGTETSGGVTIQFSSPLSSTAVFDAINVSPAITSTSVFSYYDEAQSSVWLDWPREPRTTYTVTVGMEPIDPYGNGLDAPFAFSFTTGDTPAFVSADLAYMTHYSASSDPIVSVLHRNVETVNATLYRVSVEQMRLMLGMGQYEVLDSFVNTNSTPLWQRSYDVETVPNEIGLQQVALTDAPSVDDEGERLPTGVYMLQFDPPTGEQARSDNHHLIVLSDRGLVVKSSQTGDSLAWLTELASGEPVADVPVELWSANEPAVSATTDADGTVRAEVPFDAESPWLPTFAMAGTPGDSDFAIASDQWSEGIGPWEFGISQGYDNSNYLLYFYTDRPLYQPGQTVYWKGIVRQRDNDGNGGYSLPPATLPVSVTISNDRGTVIAETSVTPNEHGTVSGELSLAGEATAGYYFLSANVELSPERFAYGSADFQVANYRKPEVEVQLIPARDEVTQGETVEVGVQADYFSGAPLASAPLTYQIVASPHTFEWRDAPADRRFTFTPFDPEADDYDPFRSRRFGLLNEGGALLSASGAFTLTVDANLEDALGSQEWSINATAQTPSNQFVGAQTTVVVHRGDFYLGLSPRNYLVEAGTQSEVDVVTLTPDGERYSGAELDVEVFEFQWNSVYARDGDGAFRWQTNVERTSVLSETLTTNRDGEALLSWTPNAGGQYQIVAAGEDEAGNAISSATFIYVSAADDTFVAWPRENNDRMELVADRDEYAPGDTARVLVPMPFTPPARALVTLERGGVLESRVIEIASNSETLDIPIEDAHVPNVFVSVLIVKGVDETNPFPAMRFGLAQLNVDTAQRELTVDVQPSTAVSAPGETISYTLSVRDAAGAPVADSELSVAVVDRALLALADRTPQPLLDVFYSARGLDVRTGATLVINRDRLSQLLAEGTKGGGGGGGFGPMADVREDFPDIALWRASVTTDENGEATVAAVLPDNLTTWRLSARAVSNETLVGEAEVDVRVTKPLQLRPRLPRFFTAGDRALIGASLLNASGAALGGGAWQMEIAGATLGDGTGDGAGDDLSQIVTGTFALDVDGQTSWDQPITVGSGDGVTVTLRAVASAEAAGEHVEAGAQINDAVRIVLPVLRYATPETVGTAGSVEELAVTESVIVPQEMPQEQMPEEEMPEEAGDAGALSVRIEPSLAAGLVPGLDYLEHFPYECTEQTVSRFLPNLFTALAVEEVAAMQTNLIAPGLTRNLAFQLGAGTQTLVARQNGDGGWGFWPGEPSQTFITAYALWGLIHAHDAGYTVAPMTIERAIGYLENGYFAPQDAVDSAAFDSAALNELAFVHLVLAEANAADPGRMSTLFDVRERLGHYGRAFLALALAEVNPEDARIDTLLDDLVGAAQLGASGAFWQEDEVDWRTLNTNVRSTAIALTALTRLRPDAPILPSVVRWLMSAREGAAWSNTQENAWSIIGLSEWLLARGELMADYDWSVTVNGDEVGDGSVGVEGSDLSGLTEAATLDVAVRDLLRDAANSVEIARTNESGQLYYSAELRYVLDALAVAPRERGIVVDRRFALAGDDGEGNGAAVSSAQVGDIISVTVSLIAPTDLHQLAVEVPMPAGVEPIDPNLNPVDLGFMGEGPSMTSPIAEGFWQPFNPTYVDTRNDRVAFFATYLPAGSYRYTYRVRATTPGEFRVLPVHAEQLYFTDVWGRSGGESFTVRE